MSNQVQLDSGRPSDAESNPLAPFFGPLPPGMMKTQAADRYPHESYTLPFAYEGRNVFLATVLDFLISSNDDFYVKDLLPFYRTDEIHVQWSVFRFNRTLADYEPELGVPRLVTQESSTRSASLSRRGLAFQLEHGFYKTPMGRQNYLYNLKQIQEAVLETCYYDVMHALLSGKNYYRSYEAQHGTGEVSYHDVQKDLKFSWAVCQRSCKGFWVLDAHLKDKFRDEGITPNVWVIPPKVGIYMTMVPDWQTEYSRRGNVINNNMEQGPDAMSVFRGSKVFECKKFDADFIDKPVCPLTRDRFSGEYFIIEQNEDEIQIYSMDDDTWATVDSPDTDKRWLVLRPWARYQMSSGILARGGSELGNCFTGNHDFMLADNAIAKSHIGHFTFYSKAVVRSEKHYAIAEDIFCNGYEGGEGAIPFGGGDGSDENAKNAITNAIANNECGKTKEKASIFMIELQDDTPVTNPIDIRGQFDPEQNGVEKIECFKPVVDDTEGKNPIIEALKAAIYPRDAENDEKFMQDYEQINTVCWQGMQKDASGNVTKINTGLWGPNVYPGVREARTGNYATINDCEYHKGCSTGVSVQKEPLTEEQKKEREERRKEREEAREKRRRERRDEDKKEKPDEEGFKLDDDS